MLNFSKNPNPIGKIFNSFEVTRSIKPSPHEKILIPENLTPFRNFNLPMHMKIEINHPENISTPPPPPQKSFKSPEQLNTTEIIPNPPENIPNTSESISTPPKNLNPSRKNLNLLEKLPLPKIA